MEHKFNMQQAAELLQRLNDSEIGVFLLATPNKGWIWSIKSPFSEKVAAESTAPVADFMEALCTMAFKAQKHFPESNFANWYLAQE